MVPAASPSNCSTALTSTLSVPVPVPVPVTVPLSTLLNNTIPLSTLHSAFGPSSLGILLVTIDAPIHNFSTTDYPTLRSELLTAIERLATLPPETLAQYARPESLYLSGWSRGVEKLRDGRPDAAKGSWYVGWEPRMNDAAERGPVSWTKEEKRLYPQYATGNVWPDEQRLAEYGMEGFQAAVEGAMGFVVEVLILVARAVDRWVVDAQAREKQERERGPAWTEAGAEGRRAGKGGEGEGEGFEGGKGFDEAGVVEYREGYLEDMVRRGRTTKARLLHYFPAPAPAATGTPAAEEPSSAITAPPGGPAAATARNDAKEEEEDDDGWCAVHTDHSCLTALLSAMYRHSPASPPPSSQQATSASASASTSKDPPGTLHPLTEIPNPDPASGLYILPASHPSTTTNTTSTSPPSAEAQQQQQQQQQPVKVSIPPNALAFQSGLALEMITGGRLRAVRHFVRGPASAPAPAPASASASATTAGVGVARNTMAIFAQPDLQDVVDLKTGLTFGEWSRGVVQGNL